MELLSAGPAQRVVGPDRIDAMRYIVIGAGAIGGTIGGRLAASGHEVVLVARGAHLDALRPAACAWPPRTARPRWISPR